MKKSFKWLFMALATVALSVSFASCGDDDADTPTPSKKPATEATMQAGVYVTETTLKYYDVVITDKDGNSTQITSENTEVVTDTVFGINRVKYVSEFKLPLRTNATDNRLRLYTTEKEVLKNFPVNRKYTIVATPKTVGPSADEKVYCIVTPDVAVENNSVDSAWDHFNINAMYVFIGNYTDWSKARVLTKTIDITFNKADQIDDSMIIG